MQPAGRPAGVFPAAWPAGLRLLVAGQRGPSVGRAVDGALGGSAGSPLASELSGLPGSFGAWDLS